MMNHYHQKPMTIYYLTRLGSHAQLFKSLQERKKLALLIGSEIPNFNHQLPPTSKSRA
ncbi:hypothetical protein BN874_1050010 [Candidatus Contendobacter odensis Run_B_J11]|uniref:Uncharacterized protein n=1 Tax=Candidatus Contendobacter odensis Run_B_J11 TaxID=1400861 RepID=A0A7U7G7X2_9GAMM|nr:hypothetical protein BN874_1050010 [Candidatus Contendobacter odensis Run_B_J11]